MMIQAGRRACSRRSSSGRGWRGRRRTPGWRASYRAGTAKRSQPVEFRAFRRQRQQGDVGRHAELVRKVPSGLVKQQHGMRARRHRGGDLGEVQAHRRAVAARLADRVAASAPSRCGQDRPYPCRREGLRDHAQTNVVCNSRAFRKCCNRSPHPPLPLRENSADDSLSEQY
jgi:hypothetical protein